MPLNNWRNWRIGGQKSVRPLEVMLLKKKKSAKSWHGTWEIHLALQLIPLLFIDESSSQWNGGSREAILKGVWGTLNYTRTQLKITNKGLIQWSMQLGFWYILLSMCMEVVSEEVDQWVYASHKTGWRLHYNLGTHFIEWCENWWDFELRKVPSHYVPPCNKSSSKRKDWIHTVFSMYPWLFRYIYKDKIKTS